MSFAKDFNVRLAVVYFSNRTNGEPVLNIFISAFPRSGTTFLAKRIVFDFGAYSSPESHFMYDIYRAFKGGHSLSKNELENLLNVSFKYRVWGLNATLPTVLRDVEVCGFYEYLLAQYNNVDEQTVNNGLTVDHTPENMINQDFISKHFPKALGIFLVRDPRAVFSSMKKVKWGPNTALKFTEQWLSYNAAWQRANRLQNTVNVRYEDVVSKGKEALSKVAEQLPPYEKCSLPKFNLPSYTEKQHSLVSKNEGDLSRIEGWKRELSVRETNIIESSPAICDFMREYGYSISNPEASLPFLSKVADPLMNTVVKIKNKLIRNRRF